MKTCDILANFNEIQMDFDCKHGIEKQSRWFRIGYRDGWFNNPVFEFSPEDNEADKSECLAGREVGNQKRMIGNINIAQTRMGKKNDLNPTEYYSNENYSLPRIFHETEDPFGMSFVAGFFAYNQKRMEEKFGKNLYPRRLKNLLFWMESIKTNPSSYEPAIINGKV